MAREFFGAGSGGPETDTGKDMMTAHKGMNISEQEYLAVIDDVMEALSKNKVSEDAVKDVLAILYSLKSQIIPRLGGVEALYGAPEPSSVQHARRSAVGRYELQIGRWSRGIGCHGRFWQILLQKSVAVDREQ